LALQQQAVTETEQQALEQTVPDAEAAPPVEAPPVEAPPVDTETLSRLQAEVHDAAPDFDPIPALGGAAAAAHSTVEIWEQRLQAATAGSYSGAGSSGSGNGQGDSIVDGFLYAHAARDPFDLGTVAASPSPHLPTFASHLCSNCLPPPTTHTSPHSPPPLTRSVRIQRLRGKSTTAQRMCQRIYQRIYHSTT
jgi:hypothetical protein